MKEQVEVVIEKLVHGGNGLARLVTGEAVFVPRVLPGERARITIRRKRKGVLKQTSSKSSPRHRTASFRRA